MQITKEKDKARLSTNQDEARWKHKQKTREANTESDMKKKTDILTNRMRNTHLNPQGRED